MCDRCFYQICLVRSLKDKKVKTVLHGFVEIVNESKHKLSKLWVNQGK